MDLGATEFVLLVLLLVLLTCYLLNRKNTKNPLHRYAESG